MGRGVLLQIILHYCYHKNQGLQALKKEFPDRITLTGSVPQEEVPKYIRAMDVSVAPYPKLERFYFSPIKIIESMATGRTVVASRIGQIPELIRDGETGVLVPPGEPKALAKAIQQLATDSEKAKALGKHAALEIKEKHTWKHRATAILDFAQKEGIISSDNLLGASFS